MNSSPKIYLAAADAARAHARQVRKGNDRIPYIAHPVSVAIMLAGVIADEEVITAALLHDTLEDTDFSAEEIETKYGSRVLSLVRSVSEDKDATMTAAWKKKTWHSRKAQMVEKLKGSPVEARVIALADDIDNLQCLAGELATKGVAEVEKLYNAPLGQKIGLYRYRYRHLWRKEEILGCCSQLVGRYRLLVEEIETRLHRIGIPITEF